MISIQIKNSKYKIRSDDFKIFKSKMVSMIDFTTYVLHYARSAQNFDYVKNVASDWSDFFNSYDLRADPSSTSYIEMPLGCQYLAEMCNEQANHIINDLYFHYGWNVRPDWLCKHVSYTLKLLKNLRNKIINL